MVVQVQVQVFLAQPSLGSPPPPESDFSLEVDDPRDGVELLKFQIASLCVSSSGACEELSPLG